MERPKKDLDIVQKTPKIKVGSDSQNKENMISLPEIAELEKPIKVIVEKIRGKIERGEYGLIIGDDISGRIPTHILGGVIKKIAKIRGVRDPNIVFIPGKLRGNQNLAQQLQGYISRYGANAKDRILIITESIESGKTLSVLLNALVDLNYKCDIATLGMEQADSRYYKRTRRANLYGANIISGEFLKKEVGEYFWMNQNTPSIFANKKMSGVSKHEGDLVSRIIKPMGSKIDEKVRKSRIEAAILVDKLVSWYLSQDTANNL